jgi:predicted permease
MEGVEPDGYAGGSDRARLPVVDVALVSPQYFEAMGTPILRGRGFTDADDENAPAVVVINERMADRFWPHQDAVGRFVSLSGPGETRVRAQIVGVARTGRYASLGEEPKPFLYRALLQSYQPGRQIVVRTAGDQPILGALRDQVRALDGRLALMGAETLQQHMQLPLFPAKAAGLFLGSFGTLALGLALLGLYAVISYAVSQRIREIGVRMALGARPRDVVRLVVWQGLRLTLIGLVLGLALAAAGTRVLSNVLYGIAPTDPISFGAVVVMLTFASLLASYLPARAATRVDPIRALRTQ